MTAEFTNSAEQELGEQFIKDGYVIRPSEDRAALDRIQARTAAAAAKFLQLPVPANAGHFLDNIHTVVTIDRLNDLRLAVIDALMNTAEFRADYFSCARALIQIIVGNELAMQRNIGLSVQLPNDASSLLPLHSDTWGSECSPYETVLWIPMVDCHKTKSMFLLPPTADRAWRTRLDEFETKGTEALFKAVEPQVTWIDIKYGNVLLFTPTIMHGNRVNREATTRWSFNIRVKGLFTPYANKRLGDYFTPLTIRPASRVALGFDMPGAIDG